MSTIQRTVGDVLRDWRKRRHYSQLDLASETGVSARHLSFLETGRANPSRDILLRLADGLGVPLRERNTLLVAGGYAPVYPERPLGDPALAAVRHAVDLVLKGHEPHPALAVDRAWSLVAANDAAGILLDGVSPELLTPPVNVMRLVFHPDGVVDRVANRDVLLPMLIERLAHEIAVTGDVRLEALRAELLDYPVMRELGPQRPARPEIVVPFRFRHDSGTLSFISTTTVFGTASDITVDELAIESFFPSDAFTADTMRTLLAAGG